MSPRCIYMTHDRVQCDSQAASYSAQTQILKIITITFLGCGGQPPW